MAITEAVKHYYYLLQNRPFEVCTGHKRIIYSQSQAHDKAPAYRIRMITYLSQFDIHYTHIKGEDNVVADALFSIEAVSKIPFSILKSVISTINFSTIFYVKTLHEHLSKDP